jgi:hypothetical protein
MELYDGWVLRLAKDFKHIIITKEVEPGEFVTLFLEEIIECLLAALQLSHYSVKRIEEAGNIGQLHYMLVIGNIVHNVAIVLIQSSPASLLFRKCSTHENGFKIYPFALDLVKPKQCPFQNRQLSFILLYFTAESSGIFIFLD